MRAPHLLMAIALVLTACGPADTAAPPKVVKGPAPPAGPDDWAFGMGKNSVALAWVGNGGDAASTDFQLICARKDGLMVEVRGFRAVESEERLSIGAGDQIAVLVAKPGEQGVRAIGAADPAFLEGLEAGAPIAVSYGAQKFGPMTAPGEAMRRVFAETCRKLQAAPTA